MKIPLEQKAHLYTLAGVCALPRALSPHREISPRSDWRLCRNKGLHPLRRFAAIPAHPQKQYTRRWRLYHFCGFYYPIREVIPIAIYHWNIGIVSRGKGKSAVAAAAYRSGEKLTNEWDGMTHDYTRKGGVVHTEIMLPPHAPPSFADRSTLWNSSENNLYGIDKKKAIKCIPDIENYEYVPVNNSMLAKAEIPFLIFERNRGKCFIEMY